MKCMTMHGLANFKLDSTYIARTSFYDHKFQNTSSHLHSTISISSILKADLTYGHPLSDIINP